VVGRIIKQVEVGLLIGLVIGLLVASLMANRKRK